MSPLMVGDCAEFALQRLRFHGFDEMPRESGELGLLAVFGKTVAGQRHQAHFSTGRKSADAPREFVAVHAAGQADVDERHVRRFFVEQLERFLRVGIQRERFLRGSNAEHSRGFRV